MSGPFNEYSTAEYIDKLLLRLWQETLSGSMKAVFFNSIDSNALSVYIDHFLSSIERNVLVLREKIQEQDFFKPYFPFLDFINQQLNDRDKEYIEQFIKEAGVYYFQRPVFSSYYAEGTSQRHEEIFIEELEYETEQILESIKNQYFVLSDSQPIILVVEHLHNAKQSTLEFIKHLINKKGRKNILLICSFNGDSFGKSNVFGDYWEEFLQFIRTKSLVVDLIVDASEQHITSVNTESGRLELEESITLSRNCFNFLALYECKEYALRAFNEKAVNREEISDSYNLLLLHTLGDVHSYLEENDTALVYYNSLLNFAQQIGDIREISETHRKIGFIHFKKNNFENAERFCNQSMKLALEINDEMQIFKSYFLMFLIQDKVRKQDVKQWRDTYDTIMSLGFKLDMQNAMSYFGTSPYGLFGISIEYYDTDGEIFNNLGLGTAEKYSNRHRLGVGYQTKGMVYAVKGKYTEALKCYKMSEKIRMQLGNKKELSYICNGLGYYFYQIEDYENADKYYNKALTCLKTVKDYHEMCMTLYNMALNFFFAFKHEMAVEYLEKMLQIMDILKNRGLKYHSMCAIYALTGVACYKSGDSAKAFEYLTKIRIEKLKPLMEKNEEYFFLELLQALLYKEEKKYDEADKYYRKVLSHVLDEKLDIIKYMAPRFYYEYALLYKEQNKIDTAAELLAIGLKYAQESNYKFHAGVLSREIHGAEAPSEKLRFRRGLDFVWAVEAVKQEANLSKLHKKMQEMNFLNNLQNILSTETSRMGLISRVMSLINNSFLVELSFFSVIKNSRQKVIYSNKNIEEWEFDIRALTDSLVKENKERLIANAAKHPSYRDVSRSLNSIISLPLVIGSSLSGSILLATRKEELVLTTSDLQVLSIAARQLSTSLEKIRRDHEIIQKNKQLNTANTKLMKSATTDLLTGLYNRQALHTRLEEEEKWIQIYGEGKRRGFSILFIDMDNFKYYNDTFGHRVGDLVLCKFAEILKKVTRKIDFAVRFGGDEFIMLLPETDVKDAEFVAFKIQQELIRAKQFNSKIEEFIGRKVVIPDKYKLSCSIGIAQYGQDGIDIETIMHQADKALYFAKSMGKNQYKCWEDVPLEFRVNEDSVS
ncbi:MAG: diguanylate cyclase [Clostridia bacterium]|nr:diguanylate cyclase [Clostridia bacterium]